MSVAVEESSKDRVPLYGKCTVVIAVVGHRLDKLILAGRSQESRWMVMPQHIHKVLKSIRVQCFEDETQNLVLDVLSDGQLPRRARRARVI